MLLEEQRGAGLPRLPSAATPTLAGVFYDKSQVSGHFVCKHFCLCLSQIRPFLLKHHRNIITLKKNPSNSLMPSNTQSCSDFPEGLRYAFFMVCSC